MELLNKYYTPSIEEFYVGFEYEVINMIKDIVKYNKDLPDYIKMIYSNDSTVEVRNIIEHFLSNNRIRVKYLDKEDIESLGWKLDIHGVYTMKAEKIKPIYREEYVQVELYYDTLEHKLEILYQPNFLFTGKIKNKSELKILMGQIGII